MGCITMRQCVVYIYDPNTMLTFDLKVKFLGFWHCLVFGQIFCHLTWSYHIWRMGISPWDNISHSFMTSVWPWPLASISKLYLHHEFVSSQDCLCSLTKAFQIGHMAVSPWDNMLCTFMASVLPWPLTSKSVSLRARGSILSEFYLQILSYLKFYMYISLRLSFVSPSPMIIGMQKTIKGENENGMKLSCGQWSEHNYNHL